jgi:DNA polymerase-1
MCIGCKDCPLDGRPKVSPLRSPDHSALDKTPVLVGEAPGRQEVKLGRPFVGRAGQLLAAVLSEVEIDDEFLHITNACLCHPKNNETPTEEMVEACRPRLYKEIEEANPAKVLLMGNTAIQAMLPGAKGVTKVRGRPIWSEEYECYIVATFHPAAVLRNPNMMKDLVDDITLFNDLPEGEQVDEPPDDLGYFLVETHQGFKKMIRELTQANVVSCDLETTGLDRLNDTILSLGFAIDHANNIWIVPRETFSKPWAKKELKKVFEDPGIFWVTQNGPQFDAQFIYREFGADWKIDFDTLLAHYTLDERQGGHGLKVLVGKYFHAPDYGIDLNEMLGRIDEWTEEDYEEFYWYHALDCHYTLRLFSELVEEVEEEGMRGLHDNILLPASRALAICERTGVCIDPDHLKNLDKDLEVELEGILSNLRVAAEKEDFNPNSPKQVKELLCGKLGLITESSSTGESVLNTIKDKHPSVQGILDYRQKSKLRSTYIKGFLNLLDENNRMHADFLLFGTETGRLSARHPNLQNIPIYRGPEIRQAVVAEEGWTFAEVDYSQLELRVAAYYSRDKFLLKAYHEGIDIHTLTASEVFQVPIEEVTYDQRYLVKRVTFGIIYGRGAYSLAKGELDCSPERAQQYIDDYLTRFEKFHEWIKGQHRIAVEQGFIQTPVGRKRRFSLITNDNVSEIERQAANTPIQSLASDICLTALTRLTNKLNPDEVKIVSTVHDSILFEIRDDVLEKNLRLIISEMEKCPIVPDFLDVVPLKADVKLGRNWGDAEEVEDLDGYFKKSAKKQSKARQRSGRRSPAGGKRRRSQRASRRAT